MEVIEKWKQAAGMVVDTEYSQATAARKAKLKTEFKNFIEGRKFNMPLDYDDVYSELVDYFAQYEDSIMASDGNGHKGNKEYFFNQLEMVAILSVEMLNPTDNPVALINSKVANILFNTNYPNGEAVLV